MGVVQGAFPSGQSTLRQKVLQPGFADAFDPSLFAQAAEGLLGFDGSAGSSKTQLVPTALRNLDKHTIVQIATGDDHFLALTSTGMVFACGNGEQHQLGRKIIQRELGALSA